ncbi:hypothetical protein SCA6_011015 [Theobroma cacao]
MDVIDPPDSIMEVFVNSCNYIMDEEGPAIFAFGTNTIAVGSHLDPWGWRRVGEKVQTDELMDCLSTFYITNSVDFVRTQIKLLKIELPNLIC